MNLPLDRGPTAYRYGSTICIIYHNDVNNKGYFEKLRHFVVLINYEGEKYPVLVSGWAPYCVKRLLCMELPADLVAFLPLRGRGKN